MFMSPNDHTLEENQPRLVLLHGFTGSPASWDAVVAALPPSYRVIAPALPGHSNDAPLFPTFAENARWIAERYMSERCHVVGYSLGARLALALLDMCVASIQSLTLIGANPGLLTEEARNERIAADAKWTTCLRTEGIDAFVSQWEALPLFRSQQHRDPTALQHQRALRMQHDPQRLARSIEVLGLGAMPIYWHVFKQPPLPVQLVAGEDDPKFMAIAKRIVAANSHVQFASIPNCGHNPLLEAPEQLASLVAYWIRH